MGFMEYRIDWEREMEHWVCFDLNLFIFGGFFFFSASSLDCFSLSFPLYNAVFMDFGGFVKL